MDRKTFERTIYKNWADYFHCPLETIHQPGTTLFPESKYGGKKVIVLEYIGKHTFAQIDPFYFQTLNQLVKSLPAATSLHGEHIQKAWGGHEIETQNIGLSYYLFPADLPSYLPSSEFSLRKLTDKDAENMTTLHRANTPEDVEEGYVEVTHQIAFGCFFNDQLVAASSGYERTDFLDIGVLTHPDHRKKGLGRAVVGALCEWANEKNMIAQYRHDQVNINSENVARSLNFKPYFKTEAFTFR
jgi:predicted GNAT family acetyltransferase